MNPNNRTFISLDRDGTIRKYEPLQNPKDVKCTFCGGSGDIDCPICHGKSHKFGSKWWFRVYKKLEKMLKKRLK